VLADPTGVRARRLTRAGRAIALVLVLWVVGLGLAGLGILPADDLPLGSTLSGTAPSALHSPVPIGSDAGGPSAPSSASDRGGPVSALPSRAGSTAGAGVAAQVGRGQAGTTAGRRSSGRPLAPAPRAPGRRSGSGGSGPAGHAGGGSGASAGATTPTTVTSGGAHGTHRGMLTAPGQVVKVTTPGHTKTTASGNSATAPGQVKTTTSTTATTPVPVQSGASPGHSGASGGGHANGT
jgi:hypothetical protein